MNVRLIEPIDYIAEIVHIGTNGRWRDVLTEDDIARYEAAAASRLAPDCAQWLATGTLQHA